MPAPEMEIIGRVNVPTVNAEKSLSPWKRNAVSEPKIRPTTRPIRSVPPQREQTKENLLSPPQKEKYHIPPHKGEDSVQLQKEKITAPPQRVKDPAPPLQGNDSLPLMKEKDPVTPQQENKRDISLEDILIEEDHRRLRGAGKVKSIRKKKVHHKNLKSEYMGFNTLKCFA